MLGNFNTGSKKLDKELEEDDRVLDADHCTVRLERHIDSGQVFERGFAPHSLCGGFETFVKKDIEYYAKPPFGWGGGRHTNHAESVSELRDSVLYLDVCNDETCEICEEAGFTSQAMKEEAGRVWLSRQDKKR